VIDLHAGRDYRVGALGFSPGFAYLGELDERLALPRRATPRTHVPAGSLAIAERQTAVYPQASPGGWHLLGRTAQRLFDPHQQPPCPLAVGDRVRFLPTDEATYRAAGGQP
jgi:KipI family sensor histidine kinase inhibitor